jgi:hypothetical protein
MAAWWGGDLMCLEVTSGGGRAGELKNIVARWPGKIDVYRPVVDGQLSVVSCQSSVGTNNGQRTTDNGQRTMDNGQRTYGWRPAATVERMKQLTDTPYGWVRLMIVGLLQTLLLHRLALWLALHESDKWPPFCMLACLWAYLAGGWNASNGMPMDTVKPSDAAQSECFDYQFTLN